MARPTQTHGSSSTTTIVEDEEAVYDGNDAQDAIDESVVAIDSEVTAAKKKTAKKSRAAPVQHPAKAANAKKAAVKAAKSADAPRVRKANRELTEEEKAQREWNKQNVINPSAAKAVLKALGCKRNSKAARMLLVFYVSRIMREIAKEQCEAAAVREQRTISLEDAQLVVNRRSSAPQSIY